MSSGPDSRASDATPRQATQLVREAARPGPSWRRRCGSPHLDIPPGETRLVGTGLALELPPGTEVQVRPRSGLALTYYSVTVLNTPGTIDEGYRGEVGVILINHGQRVFEVRRGMKVAQLVVQPTLVVEIVAVDSLSGAPRGAQEALDPPASSPW